MQQMERGHVLTCSVAECSYNANEVCHAPNINVGATHPTCDTFTLGNVNQAPLGMPDVSICSVTNCQFNKNNDCMAPGITVAHHGTHADCLTFRVGE
ncbi:MAG: DUF1540 domain-containing protein [Actinomycetota bacterium]